MVQYWNIFDRNKLFCSCHALLLMILSEITDLPEGEWFCMHCAPTKKATKEKIQRYSGPLIADLGHCEVKCTVRFPKIECIACEKEEGKPYCT